ncbi:hypothetical protein L2E82_11474 [Cichorium intybus]|uniref:Uncharacterized protein n=1 Tax=Cichorium intybus TaxID=13427 RepID=A0ACB9GDE5_CICIN|nr:hypothetical protein L2E82_11474 [Cichorium intybus]
MNILSMLLGDDCFCYVFVGSSNPPKKRYSKGIKKPLTPDFEATKSDEDILSLVHEDTTHEEPLHETKVTLEAPTTLVPHILETPITSYTPTYEVLVTSTAPTSDDPLHPL